MFEKILKFVLLNLTIGLVGCSLPKANSRLKNAPQISSKQLSDNVHVLYGGNGLGANVGVIIGNDGLVLIDSMNSKSSEQLHYAVRRISEKPVLFVINTHHHADHTGGNAALTAGGAYTIAHENSRYSPLNSQQMISDGFTQIIGEEELVAYHFIGHTYSDLLIYLKTSNVLFMGDTFTNVWHPTANVRGLSSETNLVQAALAIADENTVIVPGHGQLDSLKALKRNLRSNEAWFDRIAELSQQGFDAESMASDPVLNEIRATFVENRIPPEMADRRFLSFIQRTLSADFVQAIPMSPNELQTFAGTFDSSDGEIIELFVEKGELFARMENGFYEQLIPIAPLSFHVRFGLNISYDFNRNTSGEPNSLTRHSGARRIQARRVE